MSDPGAEPTQSPPAAPGEEDPFEAPAASERVSPAQALADAPVDPATGHVRVHARVAGVVQGVGFRPFVHALAGRLGLGGFVGNDSHGVVVALEGPPEAVRLALTAIAEEPPALAVVDGLVCAARQPRGTRAFTIRASAAGAAQRALVSPDVAACDACLAEVADPSDRRHRYPFTNCTACGPRYTITTATPYDRPNTTMAAFPLCADCDREYHDPADRRFHAQPVCCPACGPVAWLEDPLGTVAVRGAGRGEPARGAPEGGASEGGQPEGDAAAGHTADPAAAITAAAERLLGGAILAVKGLGGYHLAVDAADADAVARLRERKQREERPLALMAADLAGARALVELTDAEVAALTDPRRPILLAARRADAPVAHGVAPGNRELGVMLPYTPLHALLLQAVGRPLVLTSGNVSEEPIAHRDADARARLAPIADALLTHERPIHTRVDDSVTRVWRGVELPVRRARGAAPAPVRTHRPVPRPVLACGAQLKHTFCLAAEGHAFVSPHIGDLENLETLHAFTEGVAHLQRLFDIAPQVVAHDLHPDYLSTRHALALDGVWHVGVQHHHAHVAACLAEHHRDGPVLGLALDGLGYGTDQTLWGGELLVADLVGFHRAGHLATVALPGGEQAVREPWRMAAMWLDAAFDGAPPDDLAVCARHADRWAAVRSMARAGINAPTTSSLGRLFDALAALVGVRDAIAYEGQAAIELEQRADTAEAGTYPLQVHDSDPLVLDPAPLLRAATADLRAGVAVPTIAARAHAGIADGLVAACRAASERHGLATVAVTGGVAQNILLLDRLTDGLERAGFAVLTHRQVPPNDGGISLGQAAVAAARDREGLLG